MVLTTQPGHCDITTHPEGALGQGLWCAVKVSITLPEIVADYSGAQVFSRVRRARDDIVKLAQFEACVGESGTTGKEL